jgi:hypothetical protein
VLQSLRSGPVLLGPEEEADRGEFPGQDLAPGEPVDQDRQDPRRQGE